MAAGAVPRRHGSPVAEWRLVLDRRDASCLRLLVRGSFPAKSSHPLRALQDHLRAADDGCSGAQGEGGGLQQGDPVCEFCHPQRFYDVTALNMHFYKEHYKQVPRVQNCGRPAQPILQQLVQLP